MENALKIAQLLTTLLEVTACLAHLPAINAVRLAQTVFSVLQAYFYR